MCFTGACMVQNIHVHTFWHALQEISYTHVCISHVYVCIYSMYVYMYVYVIFVCNHRCTSLWLPVCPILELNYTIIWMLSFCNVCLSVPSCGKSALRAHSDYFPIRISTQCRYMHAPRHVYGLLCLKIHRRNPNSRRLCHDDGIPDVWTAHYRRGQASCVMFLPSLSLIQTRVCVSRTIILLWSIGNYFFSGDFFILMISSIYFRSNAVGKWGIFLFKQLWDRWIAFQQHSLKSRNKNEQHGSTSFAPIWTCIGFLFII
jgi:hypothetical protein